MIGNALGNNDLDGACLMSSRIFSRSLLLGAVSGLFLLALYRPCLAVTRLEDNASRLFGRILATRSSS